jgi:hypothetical protein
MEAASKPQSDKRLVFLNMYVSIELTKYKEKKGGKALIQFSELFLSMSGTNLTLSTFRPSQKTSQQDCIFLMDDVLGNLIACHMMRCIVPR